MTAVAPKPITARPYPARRAAKGSVLLKMMRTTDPKDIAILYLVTTFAFFLIGGAMALLIRGELAVPGQQFLSNEQYNQLFTMHGTVMLLLYATPIAVRVRELHRAAADRRSRRGVPAAERLLLLAVPVRRPDRDVVVPHPGRRRRTSAGSPTRRSRTPCTRPGVGADLWIFGPRRSTGLGTILGGVNFVTTIICLRAPGHDDVPDADLHLEHLRHVDPGADGVPGAHRGAVRAGGGPALRCARVRPGQRRRDPLAAPVLVLRPPRGLHRRAAVLRHHHRGHPGVLPQAAVRLQGHGLRDAGDRRAVDGGVGAPHVRHRRGAAAVLLAHDVPDRRPDGRQVRQLDRHAVEGQDHLRDADAVRARLPRDVPVRRPDRRPAGRPRRWTSTSPTPTSWWRTSTTCCSARSCSPPTRASTSGSRR